MSLKTSEVPSVFTWKKLHHESGRPLPKGLINNREETGNLSQKKSIFSVSSEPDILLCKTPEAVNDIPETGTNETITLGAASTSLDEMPSTEKDLMRPSNK